MTEETSKMVRARHSSLDMPDPEVVVKKKQDIISKARNKILNLGVVLKSTGDQNKKTMTQATLDYFFKHGHKEKDQVFSNKKSLHTLQKQNSVGAFPIRIEVSDFDRHCHTLDRNRPATVCVDKVSEGRDTAALALERPRKKLSFREPEITGYAKNKLKKCDKKTVTPELKRSTSFCNGILHRTASFDGLQDFDLESQAMRVVRTIGQAFEVCHKLSITAPENENLDQDEQDTLTQDLLSDRLSDITSDKPKKDFASEGASDKMSLPLDDASFRDTYIDSKMSKLHQLDILPPPPTTNLRKSPLTSAETYSSPHSDVLTSGSVGSNSLPPPGSALSAHHEIQLMREQLEQQNQQTQAAMAQLQLAREQLAAEQSARLEAQARTHQLLVHNRELLDHIAALVAHLQGGEKSSHQQQTPPHVTMPQQQQQHPCGDTYPTSDRLSETASLDNSPALQALGLNPQGLIENRAVTSCLPSSPLRTSFNPAGSGAIFNFPYPPPLDAPSYDPQLLQRFQPIPTPYPYNYHYMYSQPLLNNNYTLPPQNNYATSPMGLRHSSEVRMSPVRSTEPQQYHSQQNLYQYAQPNSHLQVQQQHQRQASPRPQQQPQQQQQPQEGHFIKPLPQLGTLTTTDTEGRVRVIVPVSNSNEDSGSLLANLRLSDDFRTLNGPPITRSTSERVPNRSELMSQVQRTMWARHTTK